MYRKVLVALVAILVLCVTAASAASYIVGDTVDDGHGNYASIMTGVANGDITTWGGTVGTSGGSSLASQTSSAEGDGVVQQTATGNLYNGVSSLSATYTTDGKSSAEQTSNTGLGPLAGATQSSSGNGRSIFSVVGTSDGQTKFSSAFVVVKNGYTADPVMTASLDSSDTSATVSAYDPENPNGAGAYGDLVSAGTVSNYYSGVGSTAALVTNGGMTTFQISGAGDQTGISKTGVLLDPEDSVSISFSAGATAYQKTQTFGETNLVSTSAVVGQDTATSSASSGWHLVDQINGQNIWEYGTVSTEQTAGATFGSAAAFQGPTTQVTGDDAQATTNAQDQNGNVATSSVTSSYGTVRANQASYEGIDSANTLQSAFGTGPSVDASTCAVDASGANAKTNMKVTGGTLKSGAFSKALGMSSESQQQGTNTGTDGSATTFAKADGAVGNTVTSYQDLGSLSVEGSGSAASFEPYWQDASAWQSGVTATGTNPYTNEKSSVYGGSAEATAKFTGSGTLAVKNSDSNAINSLIGVHTDAQQGGVSTTDGVNALAKTSVTARDVNAGTTDSVTNGQLEVGQSSSFANDYNGYPYHYHEAGASQSGVAIDGTNVNAISSGNTPEFTSIQDSGVDHGKLNIYGNQNVFANNFYGTSSVSGITESDDPGHVTSTASGAGYNSLANAEFVTGSINLYGNQQATASYTGATANQNGVSVNGQGIKANTYVQGRGYDASAVGISQSGTVDVWDDQTATVDHYGASGVNTGTTATGLDADVYTTADSTAFHSIADTNVGEGNTGTANVYGTQTASVQSYGARASNDGASVIVTTDPSSEAGFVTSSASSSRFNAVAGGSSYDSVTAWKEQSAWVGGSGAGSQNTGTSSSGTWSDVFAVAANTNGDRAISDSFTSEGHADAYGLQDAWVGSTSALVHNNGVSATGEDAIVSSQAESNKYYSDAVVSVGGFNSGSANVYGSQTAYVNENYALASNNGATESVSDLHSNADGFITSSARTATTSPSSIKYNAEVGGSSENSVTAYDTQSAYVDASGARSNNGGTEAVGLKDTVWATASNSNNYQATAQAVSSSGKVTSYGDQGAQVTATHVTAFNNGVSADGLDASVQVSSSEPTGRTASSVDSVNSGSVNVYGHQGAGADPGVAGASQYGASLTGTGVSATTSASNPTYSTKTSASSDDGSVSIASTGIQNAQADTFAGSYEYGVTASGVNAKLYSTSIGNGNSASADANIGNGIVTGSQRSDVSASGTGGDQIVTITGASGTTQTGTATLSTETSLSDSGAEAKFNTNGAPGQQLFADQSGMSFTNQATGERNAKSNQYVSIVGLKGSASTESSTDSPAPIGPYSTTATTSSEFSDVGSISGSQSNSVGVTGWFGQQTANAGQTVSLNGMDLDADTSVSTGLANADTSADADGYRYDYGITHVYNPASLSASQSATSSSNGQTFSRSASAGQYVTATGMEASTETNADAGILLDSSATAGFDHGTIYNGYIDAGTLTDTQSASASAGHLGLFDRTATASNTDLNIQTYHPNAQASWWADTGYATTSASTDPTHTASTSVTYDQGWPGTPSGISGYQISTVSPSYAQGYQSGSISNAWAEAISTAKHGGSTAVDYDYVIPWGTVTGTQNAFRT